MTKDKAFEIASTGIYFLARIVQEDGKFIYQYNTKTYRKSRRYNVLRHAGCVWAMYYFLNSINYKLPLIEEVASEVCFHPSTIEKAKKALDYLFHNYIDPKRAAIPTSKFAPIERGYIKVGAIGLSILAFLEAYKFKSDIVSMRIADNLVQTLLFLQEPDGNLRYHKLNVKTNKPTSFQSEFYDGECALALICHGNTFNLQTSLIGARNLINYKYQKKQEEGHVRDHWMMQAIEALRSRNTNHINYANAIADKTINDPYDLYRGDIFGSIACRTEALLSYLNIIRQDKKKFKFAFSEKEVIKSIVKYLYVQRQGQIREGLSLGAWMQNLRNKNTVRCDFAQHNSMAFLRYSLLKL